MNTLSYRGPILILLSIAACSLNACVPYRYVDAPAVTGQVIDRKVGRPIVGAKVSTTSNKTVVQVYTDQRGSFNLPAIRAWHLPANYLEGHHAFGVLGVEAAGYRPITSQIGELSVDRLHASGVTRYPTDRSDIECVRVALNPDA